MKRTIRGLRLPAAALVLLAVLIVWGLGLGRSRWVFERLDENGLDFGAGKAVSLADGAAYGVLSGGPGFSLPAGEYRLKFSILTDAENRIRITSSNGARIEPAELAIVPGDWPAYRSFTLLDDAEDVEFLICFEGGERMEVLDVELSMLCTDRLWTLTLLAAALVLLALLDRAGWLTPERRRVLLVLGAAVLVASIPAFRENLNPGHDAEFHRSRLRNLVSALSEGQFPVRVGGYMYNGYGSAASVFYPDLCFLLPALLMLGGATIQFALRVWIIATNALTAWTAYLCGRRMFSGREAGAAAAVLYTLAMYRLTDVYARAAFGEAAAMAVLPLFFLGLWEVVFGEKERWPLLALGAAAVYLTHVLSTVLCAAAAAVLCACCAVRIVRGRRLGALLKATGTALLLCLFFLVPMADYLRGGISMDTLPSSCADAALGLEKLLLGDPAFPVGIGLALVLGAAAAAYALIAHTEAEAGWARGLLAAGAVLALMTTQAFPWEALGSRLGGAVNFLQFPWRLLSLACLFLALGAGYGIVCLHGHPRWRESAVLLVLAVSMAACAPQLQREAADGAQTYFYWQSNFDRLMGYREYMLPGSSVKKTEDWAVHAADGVMISDYGKDGTRVHAQVDAPEGGALSLPLFGFDGYRAELDGEALSWSRGDNNRLTLMLPAGARGELRVWFAGKALWRAADAVSLATAVWLLLWTARRRRRAHDV